MAKLEIAVREEFSKIAGVKYFFICLLIVAGMLFFLRLQDPKSWNKLLNSFAASEQDSTNLPAAAVANQPVARPVPAQPIIISGDSSKYVNPDHVRPVNDGTAPTNAPTVAAVSTNAPSVTPPAVAPTPPSPTTLSDDDKASIQAKIDSLNTDIALMRRQNADPSTAGNYADKIAADQAQVKALQQQISAKTP